MSSLNHFKQLPLRSNRPTQIQPSILPLRRLKHIQRITKPLITLPRRHKFRRTQTMRDILETITQTMREIVGRVDAPCTPGSMVGSFENAIGGEIPHVWIWVVENVLFHAEEGFLGFIFTIAHGAEFTEGFLEGTVAMYAFKAGVFFAVFAASTSVNFFSWIIRIAK